MKIRTRLFIALFVVVGLGFYLLVDWLIRDIRPRYLETMEDSMIDLATVLSCTVASQLREGKVDHGAMRLVFDDVRKRQISAQIYDVLKTNVDVRIYITDAAGIVVFDSDGGLAEGQDYSRWNDVQLTLRGRYGARATWAQSDDPMSATLFVAAPVVVSNNVAGVLTVCKPARSVALFVRNARKKVLIAGGLAGLAAVLLGMAFSYWITRPVGRLVDHAKRVKAGESSKLPDLGRSEIGEIGEAFAEMSDALEARQYIEKYVQTLTHEMKSPLSAIRGAAELLDEAMPADQRQKFLKNIRDESGRIQDLVERMLQLSALESRKTLNNVEPLDILDLADAAVARLRPVYEAKGVALALEGAGGVTVEGERFLLGLAVVNLLQNAVEFSPGGTAVVVSVSAEDGCVALAVADRGAGIPEYAMDRIFERFYSLPRPGTGRRSSGLGLAFVREVAVLHGGNITVTNRPGGGVTAVLTLPRG